MIPKLLVLVSVNTENKLKCLCVNHQDLVKISFMMHIVMNR